MTPVERIGALVGLWPRRGDFVRDPRRVAKLVSMARIAVVGVGYVGLCTSAGFASLDHDVRSFDIDVNKIDRLRAGEIPIYEPGLTELVVEGVASGRLRFFTELEPAVVDAEFVFICVPTPQDEDGAADLSYVLAATQSLSPLLPAGATVVVKSTVPVGAAERVQSKLARADVAYVSNPEFLREGSAMWDFFNPDRIVVGSTDEQAATAVAALYQQPDLPLVVTTAASAELIKYAANSFLAIKLSFVNEMASLCEQVGADISDVTRGFGLDSRIGEKFLQPGPGWGGSCFPKDTRALLNISERSGVPSALVQAAIASNDQAFHRIVDRLTDALGGGLEGMRIAVWGFAFKANTDDTRESPALSVMRRLAARGAEVIAYDPIATLPPTVIAQQAPSALEAVRDADALIVLTEWPEFSDLSARDALAVMRGTVVFDTRRVLSADWAQSSKLLKVGS